jgi:hypothetical protein
MRNAFIEELKTGSRRGWCMETTKERKDSSFERTINVSEVYSFLKCHRNVSNCMDFLYHATC